MACPPLQVFYANRLNRLVVEAALGYLPFREKTVITPTGGGYFRLCIGLSLDCSDDQAGDRQSHCSRSWQQERQCSTGEHTLNRSAVVYAVLPHMLHPTHLTRCLALQ
jgi:hypothetical protein